MLHRSDPVSYTHLDVYKRQIPYSWGTAVNVQMMAFGNMGDDCGTGVAFTRDPATGNKGLFGEFITNAQGEDVVAGVRTPMHIAEMEQKFPEAFKKFTEVCHTLETHYRDTVSYTHLMRCCRRYQSALKAGILCWQEDTDSMG